MWGFALWRIFEFTYDIPHLFERFENPKTLENQGFSGFCIFARVLTLRNICGILGVRFAEQVRQRGTKK